MRQKELSDLWVVARLMGNTLGGTIEAFPTIHAVCGIFLYR
jgi:hypothetical protein